MDIRLESERLLLYPVSDDEMCRLICCEENPEMKQAYTEMLEGCMAAPRERVWHAV